jgi:lysozyme
MDTEKLRAELRRDEGEVLHAYRDSKGYLTIGIGRLIDERRGGGISPAESTILFENDLRRIEAELNAHAPWWRDQPDDIQRALANMAFQLGTAGMLNFRRMVAALQAGDRATAFREALDSKWAKYDTPSRAHRVARLIRG